MRRAIFGGVLAFAGADAASQAHVPAEYYVATMTCLAAIYGVIKMWSWVRKEMKEVVTGETKEIRGDIERLTRTITRLQCVRTQICDDREHGPLITPMNLPVVKPDKE